MSKNTNLSFLTDYITADITNGRIGINNASPTVAFDVTGAGKFSGILTLGSTISNGTFAYTLPSATGTLALTSALSSYLPLTGGTLTGALVGTSATFVGTIIQQNITDGVTLFGQKTQEGTMRLNIFSTNVYTAIQTVTATSLLLGANGATNLTIASTGAATFSSSAAGASGVTINNTSTDTSASAALILKNSGTAVAYIGIGSTTRTSYGGLGANVLSMYTDNAAGMSFLVDAAGAMSFATNTTERMRITSAGNVGIGTSSPAAPLHIVGNQFIAKSGGGGTYKQTVVGQTTAAASGVAKSVAYVGHTNAIRVYAWATQSTSSGINAIADITTTYGASFGGVTTSSGTMGTVSGISISYDNSGYVLTISVTYTGTAPTINYVIDGINNGNDIYTV